MAKATDGLAFGVTRHCRIEGLPPMPPTPEFQLLEGHPCQPDSQERQEWILELLFGNAGPSSQANLYNVYVLVSL